jgi:hypothetical protein
MPRQQPHSEKGFGTNGLVSLGLELPSWPRSDAALV